MLFHVTAQHSWESCIGRMMAEGSVGREVGIEGERWVEGNDDVKVIGQLDTSQAIDIMRW